MNKELKNIYNHYVRNNEVNVISFCNKKESFKIVNCLFKSVPFDHPDFYYINNKCCYIFEHFEVDASYRYKKKGSQYLQDRVKVDREIDEDIKKLINEKQHTKNRITPIGVISKSVKQKANIKNLEMNFNDIFDKHYKQIDKYIETLRSKYNSAKKKIKTIFIVEHSTEFGGFYLEKGRTTSFTLYCADFVLEKIKQNKKVDYFIFLDRSENVKSFVVLKSNNLTRLKKIQIDTASNKIHFINDIMDFTSAVFIPKSKLQKK